MSTSSATAAAETTPTYSSLIFRELLLSNKSVSEKAVDCVFAQLSDFEEFWNLTKDDFKSKLMMNNDDNNNNENDDENHTCQVDAANLWQQQQVLKSEHWDAIKTPVPDRIAQILVSGPLLSTRVNDNSVAIAAFVTAEYVAELAQVRPTTQPTIALWGRFVRQSASNDVIAPLFRTGKVVDSIVANSHPVASPEAVYFIARAVCSVSYDDENRKQFGNVAFRTAWLGLVVSATTPDAVQWLCASLANNVARNPANQTLFGIEEVHAAIVRMLDYSTTAPSVQWIATLITNMTVNHPQCQKLLGTAAIRRVIATIADYATSSDAVQWICSAICNVTINHEENQKLFATVQIRDAIVKMSHFAESGEAVRWLWTAASNISLTHFSNRKLFSTVEVRDAFLRTVDAVASSKHQLGIKWFATGVNNITLDNYFGQMMFATPDIREAFVKLIPLAESFDVFLWLARAIRNIVESDSDENRKIFAHPEFRDAWVKAGSHVCSRWEVSAWIEPIYHITSEQRGIRVFNTASVREELMRVRVYSSSGWSYDEYAQLNESAGNLLQFRFVDYTSSSTNGRSKNKW